jgi:hypothetical protein
MEKGTLTVANMYSIRRSIALDEKTFRLLFQILLLPKAAFSLLEIVGDILAYFVRRQVNGKEEHVPHDSDGATTSVPCKTLCASLFLESPRIPHTANAYSE